MSSSMVSTILSVHTWVFWAETHGCSLERADTLMRAEFLALSPKCNQMSLYVV